MKLDKDCVGTMVTGWVFSLAVIAMVLYFIPVLWISVPISVIFFIFGCFVTWFHRVTNRPAPDSGNNKLVTSVADGKVVIIEKTFDKEFLNRECIQVSVFMSFFDVHSNFWPMSGEITYYKYHPGKHIFAFYPKCAEENEHTCTAIKNEHGEVLFKQIAGGVARRIECYSEVGNSTERGKQCGIIKFGSRVDILLPLDADIKVKVGDLTRNTETIIAELK